MQPELVCVDSYGNMAGLGEASSCLSSPEEGRMKARRVRETMILGQAIDCSEHMTKGGRAMFDKMGDVLAGLLLFFYIYYFRVKLNGLRMGRRVGR